VPELPEVETIRRQLEPLLVGATVCDAWAFPSGKFTPALEASGATIVSVERRGKYLLMGLDRGGPATAPQVGGDTGGPSATEQLIVHLGMTGRLSVTPPEGHPDPVVTDPSAAGVATSSWAESVVSDGPGPSEAHLRARWALDDGRTLRFHDVRRFGRIAVVPAGEHASLPTLAALGPEPFDDAFSPQRLRDMVNASRRAVKTQLLSQRVVAGVGNIYADEALWRARVHPASRRLTRDEAQRLRHAVRDVLAAGITHGGTTLRDYRDVSGEEGTNQRHLDCYGRAGEPCVRCGDVLRRSVVDARATVHCPTCQRRRA
jgi:formamidopyrimidine-DNA glycosylase